MWDHIAPKVVPHPDSLAEEVCSRPRRASFGLSSTLKRFRVAAPQRSASEGPCASFRPLRSVFRLAERDALGT